MRRALPVGLCAALLLASSCSMNEFAANGVVDVTQRAAPAVQEHWDYQFASEVLPGGVMRLEGMFEIVPDNEDLLIQLVRGYSAYGFGFVMDDMEQAELEGDWDRADRLRRRAQLMFDRALMYAKRLFRLRAEGFDDAFEAGPEEFEKWLRANFDDPEDAEMLFWSGYAFIMRIQSGDPSALVDLPYARALIDLQVELDRSFFFYSGLTITAAIAASIPEPMGGDPERGKELFEQVLELTDRKVHNVQLNYARTYAVNTNDRELYVSLLEEVMQAGDVLPEARLSNKIARRRARRSLERTDELFY